MAKLLKTIHYTLQGSGWYRSTGDSQPFPETLIRQPTVNTGRIQYKECLSCFKKYFSGLEPTDFDELYIIDTYRLTTPKNMAIVSFCEDSMTIFLLDRYPDKLQRQRFANYIAESDQINLCPE